MNSKQNNLYMEMSYRTRSITNSRWPVQQKSKLTWNGKKGTLVRSSHARPCKSKSFECILVIIANIKLKISKNKKSK